MIPDNLKKHPSCSSSYLQYWPRKCLSQSLLSHWLDSRSFLSLNTFSPPFSIFLIPLFPIPFITFVKFECSVIHSAHSKRKRPLGGVQCLCLFPFLATQVHQSQQLSLPHSWVPFPWYFQAPLRGAPYSGRPLLPGPPGQAKKFFLFPCLHPFSIRAKRVTGSSSAQQGPSCFWL